MLKKMSIRAKFQSFDDTWQPKIIASVNEFALKAVKLDGEFIWHHHVEEDEIFIVVRGRIDMHYREDGREMVESFGAGELLKVPRGIEHKPVAARGTQILLIERADTSNTGNVADSDRRREPQVI
jgi:mannose-6-phosphate isomerase-like protein (cupin superfamily)